MVFPSFISEVPSFNVLNNTDLAEPLPMNCFKTGWTQTKREVRNLFKLDINASKWHLEVLPLIAGTPKHLQESGNWCLTALKPQSEKFAGKNKGHDTEI